jgi:hypothetical protein
MISLPGKARPSIASEEAMQKRALDKLMKERAALAKKLGHYPLDSELLKSRKKTFR